jgi:hypothetical protein
MPIPKPERLAVIFEQMSSSPRGATHDETYDQLCEVVNAVEDSLSGIPYDPDKGRFDGRIYPPQADNRHSVPGHPNVTRYRSVKHNTFIGVNGAIEICDTEGPTRLSKPGADGRSVWDL